jgi:hypothetical protein
MKKNTKALDTMLKSLRKMNGMKLEWGFFSDAEYPDPRGEASVAEVAKLVHNGHANGGAFPGTTTPARPFFDQAVTNKNNHAEIRKAIKKLQRMVLQGKMTPEKKMEELGEIVTRHLRESILNFRPKTLSQATLAMRKWRGKDSIDPLIESNLLFDSVKFQVRRVK